MDKINANELLYLYIQGSDEAFNELYRSFKEYFFKILIKDYKNLIQHFSIDDLLQEGMLVLMRVMWEYRDDGTTTFKTYVRNCVEKRWKTIYRQANNDKHKAQTHTLSMDYDYEWGHGRKQNFYNLLVEERTDHCPKENM